MPDCSRVASLLEKYVDEALSQDETAFVKGHLKGCRRCQKELEELFAIREHLREAVAAEVADCPLAGIWEGVAERLEAPTAMKRIWWWGKTLVFPVRPIKALAWGAALVVLFLVTLPLLTAPPTPRVVVESVESEHPVMIFQGEGETTIVWLFEKEEGKEGKR
jgi:anti-sigma factor RsiW